MAGKDQSLVDQWEDICEQYQFTDCIGKNRLYVKLSPDITSDQRLYVANGIRNYFIGVSSVLVVKNDIVATVTQVSTAFNIFIYIVGAISLFLAFFLLLIATTANVMDAVWEYGVLRSMGVTKAMGIRIFMYEAYLVIVVSTTLGIAVGWGLAALVSYQFYSFIELPPSVDFPWFLTVCMVIIALITTAVSVLFPVQKVNGTHIARVLKASA